MASDYIVRKPLVIGNFNGPPSDPPQNFRPRKPVRKSLLNYTLILIIINIVFFLLVIATLPFLGKDNFFVFFRNDIALTPSVFLQHPWTLLTSMFMHVPDAFPLFSMHLLMNMASLFFLGSLLERIIGSKRFLGLYMAGGICGGLMVLLLYSISSDPNIISLSFFMGSAIKSAADISAVGASAAIFALAGCLAVLIPRFPVLVFFVLPMKLWQAMIFLLVIFPVVFGLMQIPIANSAHVGGLLVGIGYAIYLRKKYKKKILILNKMLG